MDKKLWTETVFDNYENLRTREILEGQPFTKSEMERLHNAFDKRIKKNNISGGQINKFVAKYLEEILLQVKTGHKDKNHFNYNDMYNAVFATGKNLQKEYVSIAESKGWEYKKYYRKDLDELKPQERDTAIKYQKFKDAMNYRLNFEIQNILNDTLDKKPSPLLN
jgi:hypothetical protein